MFTLQGNRDLGGIGGHCRDFLGLKVDLIEMLRVWIVRILKKEVT